MWLGYLILGGDHPGGDGRCLEKGRGLGRWLRSKERGWRAIETFLSSPAALAGARPYPTLTLDPASSTVRGPGWT